MDQVEGWGEGVDYLSKGGIEAIEHGGGRGSGWIFTERTHTQAGVSLPSIFHPFFIFTGVFIPSTCPLAPTVH